MRPAGKLKLGYFPLPAEEAVRIRGFLRPPTSQYAALDPCIGDGAAFATIASDVLALRYGIELDAYRAEQAGQITTQVVHGDACNVHCPVESFSLLYLNPPYDFECGDGPNRRMEQIFLEHSYRWLKPGGVLVLVVPGDRLCVCDKVLASHFRDKKAYRLGAPDSEKYKQVVLFGIRRTRRERDRLRDADVIRARGLISEMSRRWDQLPTLPDVSDAAYSIPESGRVEFVYRGLPLDEIEDLLPKSAAYRQARRILGSEQEFDVLRLVEFLRRAGFCLGHRSKSPVDRSRPYTAVMWRYAPSVACWTGFSALVRTCMWRLGMPSRSQIALRKSRTTAPSFGGSARDSSMN